jgi:uncharacterized protein YrrD
MLTNLQLGAQVKSATNDNLGKVKLLVADPKNNEVTHLIIEKGVLGTRQVVADRNLVRQVSDDGKTVWLTLSQAELDQLPDFIEHKTPYITPPPPGSMINSAPAIGFAATPQTGYTDSVTENPSEGLAERMNVPADSVLVKQGADVEALDGKLGKVKRVNLEPTSGKITGFVVEHGVFSHQEYNVSMEQVESVTESCVRLKVSKAMLTNPGNDPQYQDSSGDYRGEAQ